MTLEKVAESARLSITHVSDLETGRRQPFPMGKMALMANILDLDLPEMRRLAAMDMGECRLPLDGLSGARLELALLLFSRWPEVDTERMKRVLSLIDAEAASEGFPERLIIEEYANGR